MKKRNHYAVDCEYDYASRRLLSIALAPIRSETEGTFYQCEGPTPLPSEVDPWVAEHVLPMLMSGIPRDELQRKLAEFLIEHRVTDLWFDWPEDIRYLSDLMLTGPGERIDLSDELLTHVTHMRLHYVPCLDDMDHISSCPHHALYDAIALAKAFSECRPYRVEIAQEQALLDAISVH